MTINIKINGKEYRKDSDVLFGDLVNSITSELANHSLVISEIKINGKNIDEEQENKYSMTQICNFRSIDITTSDPIILAFEALKSAKDYIKQIVIHSKYTGDFYRNKNINAAEREFIKIINSLDRLTELLSSVQHILRGKINLSGENDSLLRIAQVRLISAISELLPAKENNDYILLADVLCRELPDALNEMSELGIPVLMRLKNAKV